MVSKSVCLVGQESGDLEFVFWHAYGVTRVKLQIDVQAAVCNLAHQILCYFCFEVLLKARLFKVGKIGRNCDPTFSAFFVDA